MAQELTGNALFEALKKINPGGTPESQQAILRGEVWVTPEEKAKMDAAYKAALGTNPVTSAFISKGNTPEALQYASSTGDLSGLVNSNGQPFSLEEQQAALKAAEEENKAYYEQLKAKETADTEEALKQKQLEYQKNLAESKVDYETKRSALDEEAANKGILFSGSRKQKEAALQNQFMANQDYNESVMGNSIGNLARDYQYKYGNNAANSISRFYTLGRNAYGPQKATTGGLANIYNAGNYNFGGTRLAERSTASNLSAAGKLWNKGNKLVSFGYKNQY